MKRSTLGLCGLSVALGLGVASRSMAQEADAPAAEGSAQADAEAGATTKSPAIPQVAADTPSGMFGAKGQLAISNDTGLSISSTSQTGDAGNTFELSLRPALDYFIIDNLSFGGFLGLDHTSVPGGHTTVISLGPRFGYNIAVSPIFSVWPKAGIAFASASQTIDDPPAGVEGDTNSSNLAVNLFVPVMVHPAKHFFIGFGPALDVDVTGDVKTTVIAGRLTLGGWLD